MKATKKMKRRDDDDDVHENETDEEGNSPVMDDETGDGESEIAVGAKERGAQQAS